MRVPRQATLCEQSGYFWTAPYPGNNGVSKITLCPSCGSRQRDDTSACPQCGTALAPPGDHAQALAPGTRLKEGRYIVDRVLGQGGFGITYLANDTQTSSRIAIKEFFPARSKRRGLRVEPNESTEEFAAARVQFFQEAQALARFDHSSIVKVGDAFQENETSYMVMEYLEGQTIEQVLATRPLVPEIEAIGYIRQIGLALEVVHEAGLLHRDIKPGNIMICPHDRAVLLDFGTARAFKTGRDQQHTVTITPGYAPLEQYARRATRGPVTDLYALAGTLYHLLCGVAPVPATDRASGVALPDVRTINPQVTHVVAWAVMEGLEMEIAKRPQSARQFLDRLEGKGGLAVPTHADPLQQFLSNLKAQPFLKPAPVPTPQPEPAVVAAPPPPPLPVLPVSAVRAIPVISHAHCLAFAPDRSWIAATDRGDIGLWDTQTGTRLHTLRPSTILYGVNSLSVSSSGRHIATGSDDNVVFLWIDTGQRVHTGGFFGRKDEAWQARPLYGHTWKVKAVAFSHDGQLLASGSSDASIRLWDGVTGQPIRVIRAGQRITAMALAPDGNTVAGGGWDKTIQLWDTISGKLVHLLKGHKFNPSSLAFTNDGRLLASAAGSDAVIIHNLASGQISGSISPQGSVTGMEFSPDGNVLALAIEMGMATSAVRTTATVGEIQLWDVATARFRQTIQSARISATEYAVALPTLAFARSGGYLAANCSPSGFFSSAHSVNIWKIQTGEDS